MWYLHVPKRSFLTKLENKLARLLGILPEGRLIAGLPGYLLFHHVGVSPTRRATRKEFIVVAPRMADKQLLNTIEAGPPVVDQ